jgi:hypothetical protein
VTRCCGNRLRKHSSGMVDSGIAGASQTAAISKFPGVGGIASAAAHRKGAACFPKRSRRRGSTEILLKETAVWPYLASHLDGSCRI